MRLRRFVTGLISETDISFRLRAVTQYSTISAFTFQAIRSIFNLFKLTTILRGSTSLYVKGTLMNLYDNQPLTVAELRRLQALENRYRNAAREVFTNRVEYYHRFTGGHYTSITIRDQKTRWGSCSSRGTLSFNYRLIYGPRRSSGLCGSPRALPPDSYEPFEGLLEHGRAHHAGLPDL